MNVWIGAAIAVVVAVLLGSVLRSILVGQLTKDSRPEPLQASAPALGSFLFSLVVILGLIVALGIVDPDSLEQLPEDVVAFVPKAISAAVIVIGANIAVAFASVGLDRSLVGAPIRTRTRAKLLVRVAFLGAAGLLAAAQLGINTTVLNLAAAALFFSLGGSFALLTGLGGRAVSGEIAAGRVVRRMVDVGDHLVVGDRAGTVSKLHPAAVEVANADGTVTLLPHTAVLEGPVTVRRQEA